MKFPDKILSLDLLEVQIKNGFRDKRVVLCHGHFNVIHPGHLRFLQYAVDQGDVLIVAVLGDHLLKNKAQRFFNQQERAIGVAALHDVNWVIVLDQVSLEKIIEVIQPDVWVMGKEFEEERASEIQRCVGLVQQYGGRTLFGSGDVHYASTDLLDSDFEHMEHQKKRSFYKVWKRHGISTKKLKKRISDYAKLNFLVIGDTIVDQYVACDPVGMSAEAPVLVLRELESREFVGGAAIVSCHIRALGARCHFLSVTGNDQPSQFVEEFLSKQGVIPHLLRDPDRPTTFKIRYMVESQKMLRVSRLQDHSISRNFELQIIEHLEKLIPQMDGIVVSDFVYGLVTRKVLTAVTSIAKQHKVRLYGDLQCSSQIGNVCQFKQFDLICPTEREARIALSDLESGLEKVAQTLLRQTRSKNLLITLGGNGFIAYQTNKKKNTQSQHFPALVTNPVDVAGAGDSLLSGLSVSLSAGADLIEASVLGTCIAAIAVNRVGNIPVSEGELQHFLEQLEFQLSAFNANGIEVVRV